MIWAIVLAAGESKRMALPKLLLPYGEKSIIETVCQEAVFSSVSGTLVVLGAFREKIKEKIKNLSLTTVVNTKYKQGMLSSVQLGFRSLPHETRAAVVLLGDQPSVSRAVIDGVVRAHEESGKGIVLPTYKKERGHPVLIDLKYREEIEQLNPEVGLRGVVYSHPEDIFEVAVDDPRILKDIDNFEDYKRDLKTRNR
jgi:molybdenum cofactor cytidylyltransferase